MILLFLFGIPLFSQNNELHPTQFLVISIPAYSGADPGIQEVMNGYIQFELERAGLSVVSESEIPEKLKSDVFAGNSGEAQKTMISLGEEATADFVVTCIYKRIVNTIQMQFSCYDVADGRLVATAFRERKQTLLVEWSIADVIAIFLTEIEDRLVFGDKEPAQSLSISTDSQPDIALESEEKPQPMPEEESEQKVDLETPTASEPIAEETLPQPGQITDIAPEAISVPYLDDISKRFEIVGGMAPFVLVGKTSEYARLGLNTSLSMGYRFIGDQTQIILAMSTGVSTLKAESAATSSQILLIPLAAEISLRTTPSRLGFLIHLAGGPAAFLINPNQGGYRFKLVPYAETGIGVEIPILSRLGLLIDLSFTVYFESSQPIMGYSPSANLYFRI
jgi:hypothetical protein